MPLKEYCLKFTQLGKYTPEILPYFRARMIIFTIRVSKLVIKDCRITRSIEDMDIAQLVTNAQQIEA